MLAPRDLAETGAPSLTGSLRLYRDDHQPYPGRMTPTPRQDTWAARAGRLVSLLRRIGPGVGGPLLVIASVAAWDIRVAGLLAGLILWSYDVWTGLPERRPGKDGDR